MTMPRVSRGWFKSPRALQPFHVLQVNDRSPTAYCDTHCRRGQLHATRARSELCRAPGERSWNSHRWWHAEAAFQTSPESSSSPLIAVGWQLKVSIRRQQNRSTPLWIDCRPQLNPVKPNLGRVRFTKVVKLVQKLNDHIRMGLISKPGMKWREDQVFPLVFCRSRWEIQDVLFQRFALPAYHSVGLPVRELESRRQNLRSVVSMIYGCIRPSATHDEIIPSSGKARAR